MRCSSHRRGEALAGAPLDNAPKEYPPKIQQLVQDIASLTLLEISDLNELLKVSRARPGLVSCSWCIWGVWSVVESVFPECKDVPDLSLSVFGCDSQLLRLLSSVPAENVEDPGCGAHADGWHDAWYCPSCGSS